MKKGKREKGKKAKREKEDLTCEKSKKKFLNLKVNQPIVYPRPKAPVKMVSWWASIQANCSIIKIPDTEQLNFMTEEKER